MYLDENTYCVLLISNYMIYDILRKNTISYSMSREGFIFSYMNELY